jgi:predicted DNA-binding ribbon-helix-helix protein
MPVTKTTVRQSISLPSGVAKQVRTLAKSRRLSASRLLAELVEDGLEAQHRKQEEFVTLAKQFRAAKDPAEVERLGDRLGRMVFGG